ncbi:hypothetical protein NMY22_g15881 [Coprinellus aureogranulatus]|nr:hypothetical protein NMY22_g15881 [Coprinellus aureogranulatus]
MSEYFYSNTRRPYEHPDHASYCCEHCGKEYAAAHSLRRHERTSCLASKRTLSQLLEESKSHWDSKQKKRRRLEFRNADGPFDQVAEVSSACETPSCNASVPEELSDLDKPVSIRKGKRVAGLPKRFAHHDMMPTPPARISRGAMVPSPIPTDALRHGSSAVSDVRPTSAVDPHGGLSDHGSTSSGPTVTEIEQSQNLMILETSRNIFGIARRYLLPQNVIPTHDPDQVTPMDDRTPADGSSPPQPDRTPAPHMPLYGPFSSRTAFLLAEWYWQSTRKSFLDFQKLISVLKDPGFLLKDATDVNWKAAFKALGANKVDLDDDQGSWISDEGWRTEPVSIDIPFHNHMKEPGIQSYTAGSFRYRSIVSVIKEKLSSQEESCMFHYYPYEATWKRTSDSPQVQLYGEAYASADFRNAHEALQRQPRTLRDSGLERVVVALMLWSDSTQLTSFGGASLWPCYLFIGNESKYRRGEPSRSLGRQIAYFMKVPDRLSDFLTQKNGGRRPTKALFKYCTRALFHKQWSILLSAELIDAMKNGIIHSCPDGKKRCFFPRILTYSCDYPEKALAVMSKLGAPFDKERVLKQRQWSEQVKKVSKAQAIVQGGYAVANKSKVGALLDSDSLFPVETAFAMKLPEANPDILSALVVDILHEFEIGVWKKLYIHLLRLLNAFTKNDHKNGMTLSAELDSRYRNVPAFGRDTIRKFPLNVTEMKRKAARDYEDLLQCAIPTFESLLPEPFNSTLMVLLFVCAQWHALAKLRLHTDHTLELLDFTTTHLGAKIRNSHSITARVPTKELQREADARTRRTARDANGNTDGVGARRPATLSIFTIKFHFLGDYTSTIRRIGTTDSIFQPQTTGELYHRMPKSWYPRTDKKDYEGQLSQIERRQTRLSLIRAKITAGASAETASSSLQRPKDKTSGSELLESHYSIGLGRNCPITLDALIDRSQWGPRDPYLVVRLYLQDDTPSSQDGFNIQGFTRNLKWHLFPRILEELGHHDSSSWPVDQWAHVVLKDNRIYSHKILRTNFTTYDVRRDQDVQLRDKVNGTPLPDTYPAQLKGEERKRDLCITESTSPFVDPKDIIRGVHLIPQFSLGKTPGPVVKSKLIANELATWNVYFINRFADRDIFMRYQYGMSVGHAYMRTAAFPDPFIPSIPSDFDHCLPERDTRSPEPPTGGDCHQRQAMQTGCLVRPQPPVTPPETEEPPSMGPYSDTPADDRGTGSVREGIDRQEEEDYEEREDQEEEANEEELEEPGDSEEEEGGKEDYFDSMDDDELVQHEEMYVNAPLCMPKRGGRAMIPTDAIMITFKTRCPLQLFIYPTTTIQTEVHYNG